MQPDGQHRNYTTLTDVTLARDIGILLRTFNVLVHHKAF